MNWQAPFDLAKALSQKIKAMPNVSDVYVPQDLSYPGLALNIDREKILSDFNAQRELFYRVFPAQVDQGSRKPSTLDWMISRCADGAGKTAPRELMMHVAPAARRSVSASSAGRSA